MPKSIPCKFFLQDSCAHGASCRFTHTEPSNGPYSPPSGPHVKFRADAPSFAPSAKPLSSTALIPCIFFQKGYCSRGSSCRFAHVGGYSATAAVEDDSLDGLPEEPMSLSETRIMGGSLLITFGPGMGITAVNPSTSSPMVTIHNLASSTEVEDVVSLVAPYKEGIDCTDVRISNAGEVSYATVSLGDPDTAKKVITALDGLLFNTRIISAMPLLKKGDITSSQDATRLSCTWHAPSKSAYAVFDSHIEASLAASGETRYIHGRTVKHKLVDATQILVEGLDLKTTNKEIKKAFKCNAVVMGEPTYDLADEETVIFVRSVFENVKRLQSFEVVSQPGEPKVKAIVRFKTAEEARAVLKEINGAKQEFLGGSSLHLNQIFSAKFKVTGDVHRAVAVDLCEIAKNAKQHFVRVKVFEGATPSSLVTINVNGPERNIVSTTKTTIQKLIRGEVICDEDGTTVWDQFLVTTQGIRFIKSLTSSTGAYIYYDLRKRQLSSYGKLAARIEARAKILEEIKSFNCTRHVIPLEVVTFWNVIFWNAMGGGLTEYENEYGKDRISLDMTTKSLIFKGSPSEASMFRKRLTKELNELKTPLDKKVVAKEDCLICLSKAEDPRISPCGHTYCQSCLRGYLKSAIETRRFPIKCVGNQDEPTCTLEFPLPFVQKVMSKTELDDLFAAAFSDYIQRHLKDYQYCPTPDCSNIYQTSETDMCTTCPECFVSICTRCHVEAHDGQTCAEYKVSVDTEAEAKFQEWKKGKDVKACPSCNSLIEKIDGCNHILCSTCQDHICWVCLGVFERDEVYDHMNAEHGGIGIGD